MPVFKEMDPELIMKLIEPYEDALSEDATKLDELYRGFSCPRGCGGLSREHDPRHAFSDGSILVPRALLRCSACRYLIDPHTRVVLESGSPAKMPIDRSLIIKPS